MSITYIINIKNNENKSIIMTYIKKLINSNNIILKGFIILAPAVKQ